jgi:hypothetical protein
MSNAPVPADVEAYLDALPPAKQSILRPVFDTVRAAMPDGYELGMHFGMPGWVIPLETYPDTYNKRPLAYVSIGSGKRYESLYLMGVYSDPDEDARFRADWAATGRKLDMGKSCLRFKKLDDVDLDIVSRTVAGTPVERFLATYERIRK